MNCNDCGVLLEENKNWYPSSKQQNLHLCKTCMGKRNKKWRAENKEQQKSYHNEYKRTHRRQFDDYLKKHIFEMKRKIFLLLGGKCSNPNCPIPSKKMDIRALQIDHINSGGNKERKKFTNSERYYSHILKELRNDSKNYQLLCVYCNWIKRYEKSENKRKIAGKN